MGVFVKKVNIALKLIQNDFVVFNVTFNNISVISWQLLSKTNPKQVRITLERVVFDTALCHKVRR